MTYAEYLERIAVIEKNEIHTVADYRVVRPCDSILEDSEFASKLNLLISVAYGDFVGLLKVTGNNATRLANELKIPLSSMYNWCEGVRKPPAYIIQMIGYAILGCNTMDT